MFKGNTSRVALCVLFLLTSVLLPGCAPSGNRVSGRLESRSLEEALRSGRPTLADFGSDTCVPCKEMKATLEDLDPAYRDRVNIVIVPVHDEANREHVARYQVMSIPTQVFFDKDGKEVFYHIGAMKQDEIIARFKQMGIE